MESATIYAVQSTRFESDRTNRDANMKDSWNIELIMQRVQ